MTKKFIRKHDHDIRIAYTNAGLQRAEKMPKIDTLLIEKIKPERPKVNPKYARALAIAALKSVGNQLPQRNWAKTYHQQANAEFLDDQLNNGNEDS